MKKQAGGTFLGVTIGLLVGLAAALLVAMYVTKMPIPLVDRGVQGKPEQDAREQERNKSWNPNAGWSSPTLPSASTGADSAPPPTLPTPADTKTGNGGVSSAMLPPSLPVPSSHSSDTPPPPPAAIAPASKPTTPPPAATENAAKPVANPGPATTTTKPTATPANSDALDDLIRQRMSTASPAKPASSASPDASADPFAYFVQAGAFSAPEEAERQRAKLMMLGFDAKVSEREQAGRTVFRVRLGPFRKKGDADTATERLNAQGVESALVRVQR